MKLTRHEPTERHQELKDDIYAVIRKYRDLTAPEILAIAANIVGMLIAYQDQKTMTMERAMSIVEQNIEAGNSVAIDHLKNTQGNA